MATTKKTSWNRVPLTIDTDRLQWSCPDRLMSGPGILRCGPNWSGLDATASGSGAARWDPRTMEPRGWHHQSSRYTISFLKDRYDLGWAVDRRRCRWRNWCCGPESPVAGRTVWLTAGATLGCFCCSVSDRRWKLVPACKDPSWKAPDERRVPRRIRADLQRWTGQHQSIAMVVGLPGTTKYPDWDGPAAPEHCCYLLLIQYRCFKVNLIEFHAD